MIKKRTNSVTLYKVLWVFGVAILALGVVGAIGLIATFSPFSEFGLAVVIIVFGVLILLLARVIYSRCSAFIDHTLSLPNGDEEKTNRFQFSIREWQELCEDMAGVRGHMPNSFRTTFIVPLEAIRDELRCKDSDMCRWLHAIKDYEVKIPRCIRESIQEFVDGQLPKDHFETRINMIIEMTWEASHFGDCRP